MTALRRTLTDMGGFCLAMMEQKVQKATAYLDTDLTVKVTRSVGSGRGKLNRRTPRGEFRLTVGRPNFRERLFIKECIKAGEPFPVKKAQLRYFKKAITKT